MVLRIKVTYRFMAEQYIVLKHGCKTVPSGAAARTVAQDGQTWAAL